MRRIYLGLLLFVLSVFSVFAQDPKIVGEVNITAKFANTDPLYQELRQDSGKIDAFSNECASVTNLVLQKDIGTFTLQNGEVYFLKPINGRYFAAVFIGSGEFSIVPPNEIEKNSMKIFTDNTEMKESFTQLVMFFSDKTFEEIKTSPNAKIIQGSLAGKAKAALNEKETLLKNKFRYNITSRTLSDFLTPDRQGFYVGFIEGKKFNKLVYQTDPLGIPEVYPEQVSLYSYGDNNGGIWTAFHLKDEYAKGTAVSWADRRTYDIINHNLDVNVKGSRLIVKDIMTIQSLKKDVKFLPFDLFRSLRVRSVTDEANNELAFIQENKDKDSDFGIILSEAKQIGKPFKLTVEYDGEDALQKRGNGTFDLLPRSTWYPNNPATAFGDRSTFDLTFHYPKKFILVGVGNRVGTETIDGDIKTAKWSTDGINYAVAGFNYGEFKQTEIMDTDSGYKMEVFANKQLPDEMRALQLQIEQAESAGAVTGTTLGSLNTASGSNLVLGQAQNSTRLFNNFFGKLAFKRIAMSQQPNTFFGQAWATLVYMPYAAFVDATQRVQLFGIRGGTDGFWDYVAPHELAHQWWGHAVGWTSYHDQWMSEGFSEFSASLYVQYIERDPKKYADFWEKQRKQIIQATPATKDIKPYTVGPVTQGYRLNSAKTGNIAQNMIYPKGAYILQMLRMMMFDRTGGTGDAKFKAMMTDFIASHFNQDVSTNDFKLAVEKHMTPEMNTMGNGKMDWFFDEWIYGSEMPSYKVDYQTTNKDGKVLLNAKITQSGVSDKFVMLVPLYVDLGKGWVFLGRARMTGNTTIDVKDLALPNAPKAMAIEANKDILALEFLVNGK
jgi:Peptidase family M1 domain